MQQQSLQTYTKIHLHKIFRTKSNIHKCYNKVFEINPNCFELLHNYISAYIHIQIYSSKYAVHTEITHILILQCSVLKPISSTVQRKLTLMKLELEIVSKQFQRIGLIQLG